MTWFDHVEDGQKVTGLHCILLMQVSTYLLSNDPNRNLMKGIKYLLQYFKISIYRFKRVPIPFLITESCKIIWPFHTSQEI